MTDDIQAAFGGDLLAAFRHQHGHFWPQLAGDTDHLIGGCHFEIQFDLGQVTQLTNIGILNVAAIFAQMHGNPIGAAQVGFHSRPDRVRFIGTARLAERGHVIDVNAQFNHDQNSQVGQIFKEAAAM